MNWKHTVAAVAPMLGKALMVVNPVAGLAVQAASSALLGRPDGTEDELAAAVAGASPDQLYKLKATENKFKLDMERLGVDVFELEVQGKKNARNFAHKTGREPQIILTVIFITGYFVLTYFMIDLLFSESEINRDLLLMVSALFGILTGEVPRIMSFWFGSSKSSQDKNAILGAK